MNSIIIKTYKCDVQESEIKDDTQKDDSKLYWDGME